MGQAKLRGTFEQRQAEAIARQRAKFERRKAEREEKKRQQLAAMTPEERKRGKELAQILVTLAASFQAAGHRIEYQE